MAPPTSSSSSSIANQTLDPLNLSIVQNSKDTDNALQLKPNTSEEYLRWKMYKKWWTSSTKVTKNRWATHIIMHCICHREVTEKLLDMEHDQLTTEDGLKNITSKLDAHFLTKKNCSTRGHCCEKQKRRTKCLGRCF